MNDNDIAQFDSPAEKQARQYKAALEQVRGVLSSPEWRILVEYLQGRFRDRLSAVLFGKPEDLEEARADLRAILALAEEFGTSDLRVEGNLVNLERLIAESRASIAGQLGLEGVPNGQV